MGDPLKEISEFLRAEYLALAFLGSSVALSFWPAATRWKAAGNLAIGTVISGASSPAILTVIGWWWPELPIESAVKGAVYFWTGLLGMQLVPTVAAIVKRFQSVKVPGAEQ